MSAERWFFDTNILVYLFDRAAAEKQAMAQALWERACREATPVVSTQVLQEFFVTVTRAVKQGLSVPTARDAITQFAEIAEVMTISTPLVVATTRRVETSRLSFWDGLIVESAIDCGARCLWTEDLQNGQVFGETSTVNPFA
jgi:predicted nucleic acid-binding protein